LLLVGALITTVLVLVRALVAFPVQVSSASMAPTLQTGDVVLVSRGRPAVQELRRGDLVTFRSPGNGQRALKRVVGLPGDELVILDSVLHLDGEPVPEPYVDHALIDGYYSRTFTVPQGAVFVLGDNRGNSVDSRDYGAVPADRLLGKVLLRVWPPLRADPAPSRPRP
jgi:signal peptidase I